MEVSPLCVGTYATGYGMNMIWLVGCDGMLGRQMGMCLKKAGMPFYGTDRELDITNPAVLSAFAGDKDLRWIINCAAYTAVDRAESEPETVRRINTLGVGNLALVAAKNRACLVHFSTDYVFDGTSEAPYREHDRPNPKSVYGATKLAGEELLQRNTSRFFIFRLSWLYGVYGDNFVKTVVRLLREKRELPVVNDQVGSPTYAGVLAENLVSLVRGDSERYGLYHYSDRGAISWFDFACRIQECALQYGFTRERKKIVPVPTSRFPVVARRPGFSVLDKQKVTADLAFIVGDWAENLDCFFRAWKESEHHENH